MKTLLSAIVALSFVAGAVLRLRLRTSRSRPSTRIAVAATTTVVASSSSSIRKAAVVTTTVAARSSSWTRKAVAVTPANPATAFVDKSPLAEMPVGFHLTSPIGFARLPGLVVSTAGRRGEGGPARLPSPSSPGIATRSTAPLRHAQHPLHFASNRRFGQGEGCALSDRE